ncbi:MAG: FecR domain-containing protein [Parvibaculales bacterium]
MMYLTGIKPIVQRLLFCLALVLMVSTSAHAAIGKIETLVGAVVVQSPDGDLTNATLGRNVELGETIITSQGARADIRLNDQSLFAISPKTSITIDAFVFDLEEEHTMSARFGSGAFQYTSGLVGKKNNNRKVTLPSATVGIRGTTFTVQIDKDSKFVLSEGVVEVTTDNGSLVLDKPNIVVDIFENGQFSDVRDVTDEDLAQIEQATGLVVKLSESEEQEEQETDAGSDEEEEESTEEEAAEEEAAEEEAAEEQAAEEEAAEEEAAEEQAAEEQTSEEQPTEEEAAEEQPTEEQTAEEQPTEEQPSETETSEEQVTETSESTESTESTEPQDPQNANESETSETEANAAGTDGLTQEEKPEETETNIATSETGSAGQSEGTSADEADVDAEAQPTTISSEEPDSEKRELSPEEEALIERAESEGLITSEQASLLREGPPEDQEGVGSGTEGEITEEEARALEQEFARILGIDPEQAPEGENANGTEGEVTEEEARALEQEFARILGIDPEQIAGPDDKDDIGNQEPETLKVTPEAEKELLELGIKVEEVEDPVSGETRQVFVSDRSPEDETSFLSAAENLFLNETGDEETGGFPEAEALFLGDTTEPQKEEQAFSTDSFVAVENETKDSSLSEQGVIFTPEDNQISPDDAKQLDSFTPKEETIIDFEDAPVLEADNFEIKEDPVAELAEVPVLEADNFEIKEDPVAELAEVPVLETDNFEVKDDPVSGGLARAPVLEADNFEIKEDDPVAELAEVPVLETDSFEIKEDPVAELAEVPVLETDNFEVKDEPVAALDDVPLPETESFFEPKADTFADEDYDQPVFDGFQPDEKNENVPDLDVLKDEITTIQTDVEAVEDKDNDGLIDKTEAGKDLDEERLQDISFDRDLDGVPNDVDQFPDDPREFEDSDGDGIGNVADRDDDNDGLSDEEEIELGTSPVVADTDDDGLSDFAEATWLTNPLNPDTDEDGIVDGRDRTPTIFEYRNAAGEEIFGDNENNELFASSLTGTMEDVIGGKVVDWSDLIQSIKGGRTQFSAPQQIFSSGDYMTAIEPSMLVDFDLNQVHMSARASADFGDFGRFRDVMFQDTLNIGDNRFNETIEFLDYQELKLENVENGLASKDVFLRLFSTVHEAEPARGQQALGTNVGRLNLRMYNSNLNSTRLGELREISSDNFVLAPVTQPE